MKNIIFISYFLFFFSLQNIKSQTLENTKIHVAIFNIPKINTKISLGKKSYKIDKSATITYWFHNNPNKKTLEFDTIKRTVFKSFYKDTVYIKLRYNSGKSKMYILRKGDKARIDYVFNIPYLSLQNRKFKKQDKDVLKAINTFKIKDEGFYFLNPFYRKNRKKEAEKSIKAYNNIIKSLDSLSNKKLISNTEFNYYKKYFIYKKGIKSNNYNLAFLKRNDLHIETFELYLKQYVFNNLIKKTISLGNGVARNSLEIFDFVFASTNFSKKNKKYLLTHSLKNIKIDFPNSTYKSRLTKYNNYYSVKNKIETESDSNFLKSIYKKTEKVLLEDSNQNTTTLKNIIDKNKGKVIYIDFWASWCTPCKQAFPAYKSLKKQYNNKNVTFIFISGDKDSYKWKKAALKEKLTNSYRALNFLKVSFYRNLNLNSFPRYLIFNKEGQLAVKKAPGPDSDTIKDFINEFLKNN